MTNRSGVFFNGAEIRVNDPPGTKPSNPKDSVGIKKVPFSTIPTPVIAELGLAMLEGALKYGRHNYRTVGVRASVYYDAALRHLVSFWEGEDIDPDSGLPHIVKAMACLCVLRDSQFMGNWTDDRPPRIPHHLGTSELGSSWIGELNKKAAELIEKYPSPKEAHTQIDTIGTTTAASNFPEDQLRSYIINI